MISVLVQITNYFIVASDSGVLSPLRCPIKPLKMPILPALAPGPIMPNAAALLHIQMGRNVASLQNGDKRLAPSCSTAIKVSKYGRIVDLLICYFTRFGDADVAGLSEKK